MVKHLKILSFIFINLFLISYQTSSGQQRESTKLKEHREQPGMTLGVNLEGPIGHFFDTDKSAFSVISHFKLPSNWFIRAEAGFENLTFSEENQQERNYHYESNGSFLKLGILYDFFDVDEPGNNDNIFVGLNYGFAFQEHGSNSFIIENNYWDDYHGSLGKYVINNHWIEFLAGPRTELLKNLYMGWTLNLRVKITEDNSRVLEPFSIPGYGKGDNNITLGFSYSLEYFIPWGKTP